MKKLFSVSLIVMILISSLSFAPNLFGVGFLVSAGDEEYAPTSRSDMENKINDFVQKNLDVRNAKFTLTLKGSYISNTYNQISFSLESLFSLDLVHTYRYKEGNDYNAIAFFGESEAISLNKQISIQNNNAIITLTYAVNWGETAAQRATVENFAASKVSELGVSSMSEYDKIKTLHDFVVNFASYDLSYQNSFPYLMVANKTGICQAYAGLFYMLCKKADIPARIIIKGNGEDTSLGVEGGQSIPHAWNLVKLNGKWYHVDPTWDDPIHEKFNILQWKYFLKGNNTMSADHIWDMDLYSGVSAGDYPTSLPEYVTSPKNGTTTPSKPKTTSKASAAANTAASNVTSTVSVSSTESTVSSETAVSSEVCSTVSSETTAVTIQSTDFYSGIKEFFSGGMGKLFAKNKPMFIGIIIGIIATVLLISGGLILFIHRWKIHHISGPFGRGLN